MEIMKPRYKVIADYPNSIYTVGETLQQQGQEYFNTDFFEKYPYIFKKLKWWEERKINELPEYVKLNPENTFCTDEIFYVMEIKEYVDGIELIIKPDVSPIGIKYLLPSDREEYESYLNQKQQ